MIKIPNAPLVLTHLIDTGSRIITKDTERTLDVIVKGITNDSIAGRHVNIHILLTETGYFIDHDLCVYTPVNNLSSMVQFYDFPIGLAISNNNQGLGVKRARILYYAPKSEFSIIRSAYSEDDRFLKYLVNMDRLEQ